MPDHAATSTFDQVVGQVMLQETHLKNDYMFAWAQVTSNLALSSTL